MPLLPDSSRWSPHAGGAGSPLLARGGDRGGFVLVAVLLLIALATVLIVTTSSVSQIERRAVSNSAKEDQARQNALYALQIAMAQLQKEAGPDQRVTATADILSGGGAVTNPYWTGVWKTGTNGLDVVNAGTPQRQLSLGSTNPTTNQIMTNATWLVSGATNPSTITPLTWTDTSTGQTNSIPLAKNYGTNTTYQTVRVPLVTITNTYTIGGRTNTNIGAYAYWVSDEGVKAKVNQVDPTLGVNATTDLPKNLLHFLAPQATAAYKGSTNFGTNDLRSNTNDVPKITTLQSLANIVGLSSLAGTNAARIAPDFTTYSYGVLADVRRGGLKRDLTAAFEDSGNTAGTNYAKLNPDGTNRVYQARTGSDSDTVPSVAAATLQGLDGLRWINLYYHYNLYKSAEPSVNMYGRTVNGTTPAGIGNPAAIRPYTVAPRGIGWTDPNVPTGAANGNVISYGALSPVFLGLRWDVAFYSDSANGGANYDLYFRYSPQFVLYNPYSVKIYSSANNFRFGRAFAPISGNSSYYLQIAVPQMTIVTNATTGIVTTNITGTNYYQTAINRGITQQRILYNSSFNDTQALDPGEIRVFGFHTNSFKWTSSSDFGGPSDFSYNTAPFGLVSSNTSPNNYKYALVQRMTNVTLDANGNRTPWFDGYTNIPSISSNTSITIRVVSNVTSANLGTQLSVANMNFVAAGSADVSIPSGTLWPTVGGSGGSVLLRIGTDTNTDGKRFMQPATPSVASTGASPAATTRTDLTANVASLGSPTQAFSFFIRKKGINKTGGTTFNNSANAVPWFCGNSINFNLTYDHFGARWWDELYVGDLSTWPSYPAGAATQIQTTLTPNGYTTTSWGSNSMGAAPPDGSRIVLFDVPVQPMVSLGQFMHLQPFYGMYNTLSSYNTIGFGSMFVGGSLPSPEVPLSQTVRDIGGTLAMDHSFLANQALFDSYFFSTVPPAGSAPAGTTWPTNWVAFNASNSGTTLSDPSKALLNSRMKPYYNGGTNPPVMANLRDMEKAAANLMLDGAFNINSTSVAAWKAFLSSTSGNDLNIWDASARSSVTISASSLTNPFVRFAAANSTNSANTLWSGIRALSDTEISDLATKIVAEVKTRGPFLSMADFLNRRLGSTPSALTRTGALQAAIDKTTLNTSVKGVGVDISVPNTGGNLPTITAMTNNMLDANGSIWKTTIGAPGYFMQQDLVQALSPGMTARSDTFLIRTYGEVRNPRTGAVESRAYAEAVVQRTPELIDSSQPAETALASMNDTNKQLGRRFRIVSFRWLNSNEI